MRDQRAYATAVMSSPAAYAHRHAERFVAELAELVAIPSVSSELRHASDLRRCARHLAAALGAAGLEHVRERQPAGSGPPVVTADWLHAPAAPTLLIYGHYDVQPADGARDHWDAPPFQPVIRGDELRGRGASDDKGQIWAHVKAIECALATRGALPVNLRIAVEGEEEVGSAGMLELLAREPEAFAADVAVISDMPIVAPDTPAITYAMRGSLSATVTVSRGGTELHSGLFGGVIADPLFALCKVAASLRGRDGRIALPGFYDDVRTVEAVERAALRRVAAVAGGALAAAPGAPEDAEGEPDFTADERATIRPALVITGLSGGWSGDGHKKALATSATMKVNLRLVPDQDADQVLAGLRRHVEAGLPRGLSARVTAEPAAPPVLVDRSHPAIGAAARAYRRAFGRPPLLRRSAGSLPVAAALERHLGIVPLLMGFALPDDRAHGPNEKLHLPTFFRGIETSLALMAELGAERHA